MFDVSDNPIGLVLFSDGFSMRAVPLHCGLLHLPCLLIHLARQLKVPCYPDQPSGICRLQPLKTSRGGWLSCHHLLVRVFVTGRGLPIHGLVTIPAVGKVHLAISELVQEGLSCSAQVRIPSAGARPTRTGRPLLSQTLSY